jgi:hypothetical protein
MIAQHAQAWKQCFGSRPRSHGRPMPAGGRVCEPGEGPRAVLGALNPMGLICPHLSHVYSLPVAMQWHIPSFAQDFCAWATRTSLAAAFLSDATTPANTLPSRLQMGRGVGGDQVSVYQNPKTRPGVDGVLRPVPIKPPLQRLRPGLWFPECHMSRNKPCGPTSGCRRDCDRCVYLCDCESVKHGKRPCRG